MAHHIWRISSSDVSWETNDNVLVIKVPATTLRLVWMQSIPFVGVWKDVFVLVFSVTPQSLLKHSLVQGKSHHQIWATSTVTATNVALLLLQQRGKK